jgi:uncharacterized RDD family membrane protein YckC
MNRNKLAYVIRRVGAYLLDIVIAFGFFASTQYLIFAPLRDRLGSQWMTSGILLEVYVLLTISLPVWLYFSITESSRWQASIGKRILGLLVTDTDGDRIGFGSGFLRTVIKLLPWEIAHLIANLPTSMWINPQTGAVDINTEISAYRVWLFTIVYVLLAVYLVAIFLTERNRSVNDLVAGTIVIRRD